MSKPFVGSNVWIKLNEMDMVWVPKSVFSRAEPVMQLTIHYKDGSEYNVKNAFNIEVNKHKSGGFDIEYDYEYTVTKNLPHGSENSEVVKHVETKTHDVIAITLTERKQNNVRKTEIVEFGK